MRRLMVVCSCGERIQVPQSALGKMGLCPGCGQTVAITKESAQPFKSAPAPARPLGRAVSCPACGHAFTVGGEAQSPHITRQETIAHTPRRPGDESKRRFAEAVDLFFARRYAEALVVFDDLAAGFPGNPDVEAARRQCVHAMNVARGLVLEHRPAESDRPNKPEAVVRVDRPAQVAAPLPPNMRDLTQATLKQVLLDKMVNGSSEEVQMRATELAFKIIERESGADDDMDDLARILEEAPQPDSPYRIHPFDMRGNEASGQ